MVLVKLREIKFKIDRRINVQDRFKNTVSVRDVVRILDGPCKVSSLYCLILLIIVIFLSGFLTISIIFRGNKVQLNTYIKEFYSFMIGITLSMPGLFVLNLTLVL